MNLKRIIALAGAVLMALMYISTLYFALTDNTATMGLFKASVACTIFVPVVLYAFVLFARLNNNQSETNVEDEEEKH